MLQIAIVAVTGAVAFGFVLCAMLVSGTGASGMERALVAEGRKSLPLVENGRACDPAKD